MKNILIVLIFCILTACSCRDQIKEKGYIYHMEREAWRGTRYMLWAYYRFEHNDSTYTGSYRFGQLDVSYHKGDSVWVVFPDGKPEKSKLEGYFYQQPENRRTKQVVTVVTAEETKDIIMYSSVPIKPLFFLATHPEENEQKIQEYINDEIHKIGLKSEGSFYCTIILSTNGFIEKVNVLQGINSNIDTLITTKLKSTLLFKPGRLQDSTPVKVFMRLPIEVK